jgi:hypothetical protein
MISSILTALGANKVVAWLIEIAIVAAIVTALSFYIAGLQSTADAFAALSVEHESLEARYGCDERPIVAERELAACLVARELDAEKAAAAKLAAQTKAAREASDELGKATDLNWTQLIGEYGAIQSAPKSDDGRVPKVLLDAWARQRRLMGVTK